MMNWLKKLISLIQTNKILKKKIEDVDKKITNNSKVIKTKEIKRFITTNFNTRIIETPQKRTTKKQLENALDLGDKNREKIKKLQTFDLTYFNGECYFNDDGSQNYLIYQPVIKYFQFLVVLLINFQDRNLKGCQKKVSQLLLHQDRKQFCPKTYLYSKFQKNSKI